MNRSLFLLPWLCASVWAHQQPIRPNHITLTGDPGQLVLRLEASAPWWIEDIFGDRTPPPIDWPEDLRTKAKAYFDKHVILKVDGQRLTSQLTATRYSEEVWRYYGGSRLVLECTYPLPEKGQRLTGELTLYQEDFPAHGMEFVSYVQIQGSVPQQLMVPLEQPLFEIPLDQMIRTPFQRSVAQAQAGFLFWQQWPAILLVFSAIQIFLTPHLSRKPLGFLSTGLALLASIAAMILSHQNGSYALGGFGLLILWSGGLALAARVYHAHLVKDSESLAPTLFISQTRFVSIVCTGIAVYLLIKGS